MDEYIWGSEVTQRNDKHLTLIIYDISQTKERNKMVKFLKRYGIRVQKSAFEAVLSNAKFEKLLKEIEFILPKTESDCIKIYRLKGVSETYSYGSQIDYEGEEDVIFL